MEDNPVITDSIFYQHDKLTDSNSKDITNENTDISNKVTPTYNPPTSTIATIIEEKFQKKPTEIGLFLQLKDLKMALKAIVKANTEQLAKMRNHLNLKHNNKRIKIKGNIKKVKKKNKDSNRKN